MLGELLKKVNEVDDPFKAASPEEVKKRGEARFPLTQEVIDILINSANAVIDALGDAPDGDDTQDIAERFLLELDFSAGNTTQVEYLDMIQDYANRPVEEAEDGSPFQPISSEDEEARRAENSKRRMDMYIKTSIKGRRCSICGGSIPKGKKYLLIGGGYHVNPKNVCNSCLKDAAQRTEG